MHINNINYTKQRNGAFNCLKSKYKNIYFSGVPTQEKKYIEGLKKRNVKTVVVLMDHHELFYYGYDDLLSCYKQAGLNVIHIPIHDYGVPKKLHRFSETITHVLSRLKKHNIAVHCMGGHGRTGLFNTALMMQLYNKPAIMILNIIRTGFKAVESDNQIDFLLDYQDYIEQP